MTEVERKKVEEALRESEEQFRRAVEDAPIPIIMHAEDGQVLQISRTWTELTGYTLEDMSTFDSWLNRAYGEGADLVREHMQKLFKGKQRTIGIEFPIHTNEGQTRYWSFSASSPGTLRDGRRFVVGMAVDITERKKAEEALRKYRDELELRVQDRTRELRETNKKLEAVNLNLLEEIKAHAKARAELEKAKDDLGYINEELKLEIEEEKQVENQLMKSRDAAEAAAKAKAAFLANMSHEIRTPMNSILGFTELLLDEPLSPEQRDNLETIRLNGDALLVIINDILDFSKMESDKVVLEEQPFNLHKCVEESLDLVAVRAAEKELNLAYIIDKGVPNTIIGDPGRLRQVLGNLLSNAIKFTDEGEVTVSISGRRVDETDACEIRFDVKDTGIGIPADNMDKLFQPFNQMEPSTARLYGGTGLGLAISKRLVEMMGGCIWAESKEGNGSTFHFIIKASSSWSEPEVVAVSPQMVGKRVLIVEDNKTNRRILSKQVYDWGMIPMATSSGQEALRYIQRGDDFDIAILDMDLQTMDSLELEEMILKYNKALPLVLLTSLVKRIPPGHAYLTKPIKPSKLYQIMIDILSQQPTKGPMGSIFVNQPAPRPLKTSEVNQPVQSSPLRILLAEDNVSSQKVAQQMLKKMGYKVDTVANGIEVLQSLERQHYDVVLMDAKMPEMDGLEAARVIRKRWPNNGPRIIAITAYALQGDREKCLEAGMDGYIAKPVQVGELAEVLKKCALKVQEEDLAKMREKHNQKAP